MPLTQTPLFRLTSLFVKRSEKTTYRGLFAVAAIYNLAFAAWSGCSPDEFFAIINVEPPEHWGLIAPIVGSFALCYAYAAWFPEHGDLAIALGLASKVLGPTAWLVALMMGESTPRLFPLILVGDLVWWLPLLIYLFRRLRQGPMLAAAWCFGVHLFANIYLFRVAAGTELVADFAARQRFVLDYDWLWTATWLFWSLSSMSLLGFCIAWATRLTASRIGIVFALAVIAVGVMFDLYGETVLITEATRSELSVEEFTAVARRYQWLGPAIANGLYCVGGLILSVISWRIGFLRGATGILGFAVWCVGIGLTAAAVVDHRVGMIVFGGGVMILFLPWSLMMVWRLRSSNQSTVHSKPPATKPTS
jgi:hypothetical protein